MVFPNLFIAEIQLFVIQPLGGGRDGAACHRAAVSPARRKLNERMLRPDHRLGRPRPASLLADDSEM